MARNKKRRDISGYKGMWLFAMFDLPVITKTERRQYTKFRKALLKQGFTMLQYSIYARYFPSEEASISHRKIIKSYLPEKGQVRLITITDKQYGKMQVFFGKKREPVEDPPAQIMLF